MKRWKTVSQSYYRLNYTEEKVRNLTQKDLFPFEKGGRMAKIGIIGRYSGIYENRSDNWSLDVEFRKSRLKENLSFGYWKMVSMYQKSLGVVWMEMRIC